MRYLGLGISFGLVGFLVTNAAVSLLALLAWRSLRGKLRRAPSLFLLRMMPAASSLAVVFGLVLPAFLFFEPRETSELVGPKLIPLAVLAGALIAAGLFRALTSWIATRRLLRAWLVEGVRVRSAGIAVPVYRVPRELPLATLVGVIHPRLFVSGRFLDALSAEEARAVLSHETGHLAALDNLKRAAMRLAPDWLSFLSAGREMDLAWAAAAEEAADDHAVRPGAARALDLASSLLKAARMIPLGARPLLATSDFCDRGAIAARVTRLLEDSPDRSASPRLSILKVAGVLAVPASLVLLTPPAFKAVYFLTETAVRLLQ